jgi:hypothetical protein
MNLEVCPEKIRISAIRSAHQTPHQGELSDKFQPSGGVSLAPSRYSQHSLHQISNRTGSQPLSKRSKKYSAVRRSVEKNTMLAETKVKVSMPEANCAAKCGFAGTPRS